MREKYMLALANLVNGSELGYEDRSNIPQYKKDIEDYVDSLEEKNQRYEELIDKAAEYIKNNQLYNFEYDKEELFEIVSDKIAKDYLLDILKEVE